MTQIVDDKKTILHLSKREAEMWCSQTTTLLTELFLREGFFIDEYSKVVSGTIEGMMHGGARRAHGSPHIRRIAELKQSDHRVTRDLMVFIINMNRVFLGERLTPFESETMGPEEARSWLATTRRGLKLKLQRDRRYLQHCEQTHTPPHKEAAIQEQIKQQEDIVLLLDELIKTYPPLKLSRPKQAKGATQ